MIQQIVDRLKFLTGRIEYVIVVEEGVWYAVPEGSVDDVGEFLNKMNEGESE